MDSSRLPFAERPVGARDLLLIADDEAEVLARARRLLVPLVGDELAVTPAPETEAEAPRAVSPPELPPSLPWPPQGLADERPGRVWYAPSPNGTWAELHDGEDGDLPDARWFAARLGGTPSAGWVLLERSPDRPPLSQDELNLLREAAVAAGFALVAAALSRQVRDARAAADAATHRWAALARVNGLLVRSPDYDDTVAAVLEAVVPYLADWALLELVDEGGITDRRVGRHTDPHRNALLGRLQSFPRRQPSGDGARSSIPARDLLVANVGEPDLRRLAEPCDLEALEALGPRSLAVVRLCTGERTVGTLTLATAESGQIFTQDDLALFRSVAQQAALALISAEMYQAAERARREREEVLAIVSHDLKNPLNTVGFAVAILGMPDVPEARRTEQVRVISRAAREMNELIERLLDAARIDSGRFHVDPAPESLDALIAEALRRAAPAAEQAGVRCPPPSPCGAVVLADRGRLLQVFANLLSNAISFSPPDGTVRIAIELEPDEARITVRDEGPGIDLETQRHIFDRYWQARRSGRSGAGLGLSIARGIVEAHGGRIGVESRPGHGSSFHFTVPRLPEGPAAPAGTHST